MGAAARLTLLEPGAIAARPADPADPAGSLVASTAQVAPGDRVRAVAARFFAEPDLDAVALVEAGRPVGLLTREHLLLVLARGFGQELYAGKPVSRIADLSPLVVPASLPAPEVVARALRRPGASVYDEVIVVDGEGAYAGLVPVRDLVLHQSLALARSSAGRDAALARARDLEELEVLRGRFLAHATHELRSPVNAIAALAEILRQAAEKGDLARVADRVRLLQQSATALRGTVNNILDLSRLQAGRTEVMIHPVPLAPLLEEVASTARLLVGARPITVTVAAQDLVVETDRLKLRQVLVNLAGNAAKFTDAGAITLAARAVPGGGATLSVTDTGPGIRASDLPRLFQPFGQLEDALTKVHEGTGLGLAISQGLAQLLGGRLEVASTFGAGTCFTLHLPARPHPAGEASPGP